MRPINVLLTQFRYLQKWHEAGAWWIGNANNKLKHQQFLITRFTQMFNANCIYVKFQTELLTPKDVNAEKNVYD